MSTAATTAINVLLVTPAKARRGNHVTAVLPVNADAATFDGPVAAGGLDSYAWSREFVDLGGMSAAYDLRASTLSVTGTTAAIEYARLTVTR